MKEDATDMLAEIAALKARVSQLTDTLMVLHAHAIQSSETMSLVLGREAELCGMFENINRELSSVRLQIAQMREDADTLIV